MKAADSELPRLLEAYFDGRLSPSETAELTRRLQADPAARRAYWEAAHWHSALSVWGEQHAGHAELEAEALAETSGKIIRPARWIWTALAAAACLALILTVALRREHGPVVETAPLPALAAVTYGGDAVWAEASPVRAGVLPAGDYELQRGVVRFATEAGALVTVAAPAQFRLVSAGEIELRQGRLTARMVRESAQLVVRVGDMEVRDLGTAFGIDANDAQRTLVSVFDGLVAVKGAGALGAALQLAEGQSLIGRRSAPAGAAGAATLERADYAPGAFQDLWPLTVGINDASRLVEFLPPGPLLRPLREYRANDHLFLFPEQRNVTTTRPLGVDLSPEVRAWPESAVSPYPLPAGVRVNSHLVFFQPEPTVHGPRRLHGSITFHQRILGVMCCDQGLQESDALLGDPKADYVTPGQRRGLEEADKEHYRGARLPHDSIRISPDGRTLTFDFYVSDEREQLRVLVAAD